MSTNITTAYKSGDGIILQPTVVSTTNNAGTSIAVTLPRVTRILAIHAFTTVTGLFDIGDKDGSKMQQLDYSKLTTLTIAALQEALAKIETLETKVAALEAG